MGLKGKKRSEKTKKKISNTLKGRKLSEETKGKIREALKGEKSPNYGKVFSKEHNRKISKALKGNKNVLGYHWKLSEKTKKKLSEVRKGRKHSKKTKKEMSKIRKKYILEHPEFIQQALKNGYGEDCYYNNEFFPSLQERDCYIKLKKSGFKVKHNFEGRFDFLINDKIVVEFHPFDLTKLTDEQYYLKRRKLLDEYGYKDLKLIVIKNLQEIEKFVK